MALIPPFYLNCVVSIGIKNPQDELVWIGTGCIVGRPMKDGGDKKLCHTFLVTNKHILQDKKQIFLRFSTIQGTQVKDYPIELEPNNVPIWVGHHSQEVDVAVFNINPNVLTNDAVAYAFFHLDEHTLSVSEMQKNNLSEGDSLFVLGFPMGIVSTLCNHVISRSGSIARIRDLLNNRATAFLIDASIFPGNSGSPVITRPEIIAIDGTTAYNNASLIGIVKSYVPFIDVAISQQTQRPRITFEENSGLALVETVDSIKETVELCYEDKMRVER